jgi:hypothetical protein
MMTRSTGMMTVFVGMMLLSSLPVAVARSGDHALSMPVGHAKQA